MSGLLHTYKNVKYIFLKIFLYPIFFVVHMVSGLYVTEGTTEEYERKTGKMAEAVKLGVVSGRCPVQILVWTLGRRMTEGFFGVPAGKCVYCTLN